MFFSTASTWSRCLEMLLANLSDFTSEWGRLTHPQAKSCHKPTSACVLYSGSGGAPQHGCIAHCFVKSSVARDHTEDVALHRVLHREITHVVLHRGCCISI
jgi:hypothetical protein